MVGNPYLIALRQSCPFSEYYCLLRAATKRTLLYDNRSKPRTEVAMPTSLPTGKAMQLQRRVLLKMIESRHMPIRKDLEANLFGDAMGLPDSPYGPRLLDSA
jgi:hypothetical protein